jgi:hypothetical protein
MSEGSRILVVDRIEGERAVLVDDETRARMEVPTAELPFVVREGDVLRVPLAAQDELNWESATVDEELKRERLEDALRRLDRLKRRDPGGDVKL